MSKDIGKKRLMTVMDAWLGKKTKPSAEAMETDDRKFIYSKYFA